MNIHFETNETLIRIIFTFLAVLIYPTIRYVIDKLLERSKKIAPISPTKTLFLKKSVHFILGIIVVGIIVAIWGVAPENVFLAISSVFAVIGVALFAQWSVLSNITAGFVIFLSLGIKIGDKIKMLDKDFPMIAEVEDIRTFYIYLRTETGDRLVYPNNLLLQKGISIQSSVDPEKK